MASTISRSAADTLDAWELSPEYAAVMECEPAASELTVSEAPPLVSTALPRTVGPSRNCTKPVGVPKADVTVALKVTACPTAAGFSKEVNVVVVPVVLMASTISRSAADSLDAWELSPEYAAVMECE
jgi:hypothetical protein